MRAFEDGRKEHYQRPLPEVRIEECGALSPQEAETKLRQMIETQGDVLGKVCRVIVVLRKVCRVIVVFRKVCRVIVLLKKMLGFKVLLWKVCKVIGSSERCVRL